MFIHPLLLWFCQRQKQHIVWMDSGSRNLSRPFSPKGVKSLPILSKRQIFLRFEKWVQIRMEPSDFGFWWNFERKFDGLYLLAKWANYLYLPPSTVKQEKLEIVLSLIGHVGSNPTISARSRRFKRICDFFFCIKQRETAFFLLQYALYMNDKSIITWGVWILPKGSQWPQQTPVCFCNRDVRRCQRW